MRKLQWLVSGVAIVGVLTAACGGDGRTREEYLKEANAVCDQLNTAREETAPKFFPSEAQPPTLQQLQSFYAAFGPQFSRSINQLADIKPSKGDAAEINQLIDNAKDHAEVILEAGRDSAVAQRLLATDEAELHTDDEAMSKFGYKC
ncbi:MAG: hypothetical protein QOF21_1581 [Actinomycetota bacterium]|jgi:hypothetical protein